ncbi:ABC transporter ATP-binding protein [Sulfidibacter corallicola]
MQTFWRFSRRYVVPYLWWYLAGFAFIVFTQLLAVGIINETKNAIDAAGAADATARTVVPYVVRIALFAVCLILVRTGSRLLIFTPGRLIEYRVRNDFYSNLLLLQRDFYEKHESGDLVSRCSNDIGFVRAAYGFGFLQIANVSVTLSLGLTAMLMMDLQTTIFVAIPMILSFAFIQISIRYVFTYWRRANEQLGSLSSLCLASYKGISAIQNYHAEPAVTERFSESNENYLETMSIVTKVRSFMMPMVQAVGNLSIFLVLWFVGPKIVQGDLTMGQITAFLGYIGLVMPPLLSLGWMLNVFNRAIPAMERLQEIITAKPTLLPAESRYEKDPSGAGPTMVLENLHFTFTSDEKNPNPFGLKDVDLTVPPGKVIGIAGPLGSGKSVLLETILRLNDLPADCLYLNGADCARMDLVEFRDHFSFAPQKAWLFSTTLRRNLLMALDYREWERPGTEARLLAAIEAASFDLDPKVFPLGLETEVGTKGVMLSGGQRQRIALARALLKPADVYILDDVLSAVDHETEKRIIRNLKTFAAGKSFLIASHRISAIQWADEILVLGQGGVAQRGTHETLIQEPGFYRDIYQYQAEHPDE